MTVSPFVIDTVKAAAAKTNVDPGLLVGIGVAESGLTDTALSTTGVQGAFQITKGTWKSLMPGIPFSTDLSQQAYAAGLYVQQLQGQGLNTPQLVYAAYNAGPGVSQAIKKEMANNGGDFNTAAATVMNAKYPGGMYSQTVTTAAKIKEITGGASRVTKSMGVAGSTNSQGSATTGGPASSSAPTSTPAAKGTTTTSEAPAGLAHDDPLAAIPLVWSPVSGSAYEDSQMKLVDYNKLDNLPGMEAGLVGNPHLKRIPSPAVFKISLSELTNQFLPRSLDDSTPLEIRLNCSLSQVSQTMKHVINKANTRSGFHLTFWGMEPDVITGSGSTGLFMNSFGVTTLMSAKDNSDYTDQVNLNFYDLQTLDDIMESPNKYRVAAQDAFIDLLSAFKNNGVVRFKTDNYTGAFDNRKQLDSDVWSVAYGSSTYERNARNNDVMVKGQIYMRFKSNIFQGYFKSLSWVMDATSPFHWKFDFTFQVQRTLSYVYYAK